MSDTKKKERFYVMSESEFKEALDACVVATLVAEEARDGGPEVLERMEKAEAACRSRPVPEFAEKFYCAEKNKKGECMRQWYEEIKFKSDAK